MAQGPTSTESLSDRYRIGSELSSLSSKSWTAHARSALWAVLTTWLALGLALAIVPGIWASRPRDVLVVAVLVGVLGAVIRPVLNRLALALGWVGVALVALFGQALVIFAAISLAPGISGATFWKAFVVSWIAALALTIVGFFDSVDEDDVFLGHVIRSSLRRQARDKHVVAEPETTGVVFVQMDGVPLPLLRHALVAGNLPTLSRWVRAGSHSVDGWTARVPSTTPISQAGILHGNTEDMPAFRWYERDTGKLVVANHPPDAALIESRVSNGRGLLVDDGVSVSNLFSGDAPLSALTMSGMKNRKAGLGTSADYAAFFAYPYGFARALFLTIGEMVKEVYQARRAKRMGLEPRIDRHGSYILLRGVTNVLLRDLNVALVAEQMMRGAKSIYVDFVDYDEIAHHAGVARPESLRAMEGIDEVLGLLERVAAHAPRPYEFVVVSDHGQSQGATFKQRHGSSLEDHVRDLMGGAQVEAATGHDEDWGPLNTLLTQLTGQSSVTGRLAKAALRGRTEGTSVTLGPQAEQRAVIDDADRPDVVVVGSGNLGLVYFALQPERLALEDLEELWPGLVASLARTPYVGFVVVDTRARGPVAVGPEGLRVLESGEVEGVDPLAGFGEHAAADFLRVARFPHAPDLYLNSFYDPELMEVAAFEELVGCHGGVGGWQTEPILVHPAAWKVDGPLVGAEAVHHQLVRWLEALGHRRGL